MSLKPASYYLLLARQSRDRAVTSLDSTTKKYFDDLADRYDKQAEIAARFEL